LNKISKKERELVKELAKKLAEKMEKLGENGEIIIHSKGRKITKVRITRDRIEVPRKEFWSMLGWKMELEGWEGVWYPRKKYLEKDLREFLLLPRKYPLVRNSPWNEAASIVKEFLQSLMPLS
jgi:hypothetical protein